MQKYSIIQYSRSILPFFFLLVIIASVGAQNISFQASSDARQVVIGNTFTVSYTLKNADPSDFTPPNFKNFQILSGPSQSTSVSIINGRKSQEIGYSYVLQPKSIGKYRINPASILANGKKVQSNAIQVEVLKGKGNATTQAQIDQEIGKNVFVKLIPNTSEARIGQQIVLDYKLFTKLDINQYNFVSEPEYPGFYAQEMRQFNNRPVQEVIDGEQYTTAILKRVALFPQQAGVVTLDPALLRVQIVVDKTQAQRRSFFFRPKTRPHNLRTESLQLNVLPLPDNPPATFTGAVGKYQLSSLVDRNRLTTDDAVAVRMTIQGNGDVKQIQSPALILNDSFEVYDPKIIEEITYESQQTLYGKKEIEYLVLPKYPGRFTIQPEFTYFDTDSLRYVTLRPQRHALIVLKGSNKTTTIAPTTTQDIPTEDIRFIQLTTNLQKNKTAFFGSIPFWILLILPFFALGGTVVYKRIQDAKLNIDPVLAKRNRAKKLVEKRLVNAKKYLGENKSHPFYDEISRAMLGYVCDKLNIQTADLTKDNVQEKLRSLDVKEENINQFLEIIKNCEIALFAGMDNSAAMQATYDNTLDVVTNIEANLM